MHSPFVFRFVTQCLYKKIEKKEGLKSDKLYQEFLIKGINYFQPSNVFLPKEENTLSPSILKINSTVHVIKELKFEDHLDFVVFRSLNSVNETLHFFEKIWLKVHNDTVFFIKHPYQNKSTQLSWEAIKNDKKVTVTVDCFYFGFFFVRKEQSKEHFTIRV